jgi:hypothetical protein
MGRKHEEIWQSINELDDRVTRLEEGRGSVPVTPQHRPWRVGDVVRLEDCCDLNEKFRAMVGTHCTITGGNEHYAKIGVHLWPASALTLIRAAGEPQSCNDLEREVERLTAERDALRARIEAGRVMYGGMYGHQNKFEMWTFEHVDTDTMTARLIDIAPIADAGKIDERKGERRKSPPDYVTSDFDYYSMSYEKPWIKNKRNSNDRRRTPGTRADRKVTQ